MADANPPALPLHTAALGLVLLGTAALPLYDGNSLMSWLFFLAQHSLLAAALVAFVAGAPCLFGLAVAVASFMRDKDDATDLLLVAMQLLHFSLLLIASQAIRAELDHAWWFAGLAFVSFLGVAGSEDRPRLGPRTLVRWGAAVIAGTTLWLHFQEFAEQRMDVAIHVALAASLLLAVSLPPARGAART